MTIERPIELQRAIDQAVAAFNSGNIELADSLCRKMTAQFAAHADAFTTFGHLLLSTNRLPDAIPLFRRAVEKEPDRHDLHVQFAQACTRAGQFKLALEVLTAADKLFPNNAEIINSRGYTLAMQGKHKDAMVFFEKAIAIHPRWASPRENLCSMLHELREFDQAEQSANELLAVEPKNAIAFNTLGIIGLENEKPEQALKYFELALAQKPRDVTFVHNAGLAYSNMGNIEKARETYRTALSIQPTRVDILLQILHITKLTNDSPEWGLLENLSKYQDAFPPKAHYQFHFAYGKAYADIGEHDTAFEHYAKDNQIKHAAMNFRFEEAEDRFNSARNAFTPELLCRVAKSGSQSNKPVFIVGMPRSGSTLIEQIITSHPAAYGGGEMTELPELVSATTAATGQVFIDHLNSLTNQQFAQIAKDYLAALEQKDSNATRVCDKQLANFVLLPLIATLFPNATIVHCLRDPLDTCLSCFFNDFARSHFYTTELSELGRFYRMYRELMEQWQALDGISVYTIHYEKLIEQPEAESRRLIEAIGLPWDDACLSPHENRKSVRTASVAQVREPIYNSSIGRWRNYSAHLGPLIASLGPYGKAENAAD